MAATLASEMDVLFTNSITIQGGSNDSLCTEHAFHKTVGMLSLVIGLFDADKLVSAVGRAKVQLHPRRIRRVPIRIERSLTAASRSSPDSSLQLRERYSDACNCIVSAEVPMVSACLLTVEVGSGGCYK